MKEKKDRDVINTVGLNYDDILFGGSLTAFGNFSSDTIMSRKECAQRLKSAD
jgi:hypothetical protein